MGWEEILKKKKIRNTGPVWKPMSKPKTIPTDWKKKNMEKFGAEIKETIWYFNRYLKMVDVIEENSSNSFTEERDEIQRALDEFTNRVNSEEIKVFDFEYKPEEIYDNYWIVNDSKHEQEEEWYGNNHHLFDKNELGHRMYELPKGGLKYKEPNFTSKSFREDEAYIDS